MMRGEVPANVLYCVENIAHHKCESYKYRYICLNQKASAQRNNELCNNII